MKWEWKKAISENTLVLHFGRKTVLNGSDVAAPWLICSQEESRKLTSNWLTGNNVNVPIKLTTRTPDLARILKLCKRTI